MTEDIQQAELSSWVKVGKIVACHGLRGDLKINPVDPKAIWAETVKQVILGDPSSGNHCDTKKIRSFRHQKNIIVVKFEGVNDRNAAELLVGKELYLSREVLPSPEENEYWADDLIGLTVVDKESGRLLGKVVDFVSSSNQDFLEIMPEESLKTAGQVQTVPFNDHFVPVVDLSRQTVFLFGLNELFN